MCAKGWQELLRKERGGMVPGTQPGLEVEVSASHQQPAHGDPELGCTVASSLRQIRLNEGQRGGTSGDLAEPSCQTHLNGQGNRDPASGESRGTLGMELSTASGSPQVTLHLPAGPRRPRAWDQSLLGTAFPFHRQRPGED